MVKRAASPRQLARVAFGALALAAGLGLVTGAHAACRMARIGSLSVDMAGGKPHIDGSANGYPMRVAVDTANQSSVLSRETAEGAKLVLQHTDVLMVGSPGETRAYRALVDQLDIGPLHWKRAGIGVMWDDAGRLGEQAVLGADYVLQTEVEVALAEGQLRFFRPDGCPDAFLAYWDPQAVVVPMQPRGRSDHRAVVEVVINGKPVRAMIDTGSRFSQLDVAAAQKVGIPLPQDTHARWPARLDTLDIGEESIRNTQVIVADLWGRLRKTPMNWYSTDLAATVPEMLLGADFLKAHRVLMAPSQGRLYLSYLGGPVFSTEVPPP